MADQIDEKASRAWRETMENRGLISRWASDQLGRLSLEQLGDLCNGNHANAPKELVKAARDLQGCEWLG